MIATAYPTPRSHEWQQTFLAMLPMIERHARYAFRGFPPEAREEALQESTANALIAYARLVDRGREHAASATSLARYAVRQFFAGRRVGTPLNVRDVLSPYCRQRKGIAVGSLNPWDDQDQQWREILVEDRHATPADLAASRIDFSAWLRTLSPRDRRIALKLARGDSTGSVARKFRLSPARISQLRQELAERWRAFQGEAAREFAAAAALA